MVNHLISGMKCTFSFTILAANRTERRLASFSPAAGRVLTLGDFCTNGSLVGLETGDGCGLNVVKCSPMLSTVGSASGSEGWEMFTWLLLPIATALKTRKTVFNNGGDSASGQDCNKNFAGIRIHHSPKQMDKAKRRRFVWSLQP